MSGGDVQTAPIPSQVDAVAQTAKAPHRLRFREYLKTATSQYPFQTAGLIGAPLALLAITFSSGFAFYRTFQDAVLKGEPWSALIAICVATYALLASQTITLIKSAAESAKRDAAELVRREAMEKELAAQLRLAGEERAALRLMLSKGEQSLARLNDMADAVEMLARKSLPNCECVDDTPAIWGPFQPGSEFWAVAPQMRGDVVCHKNHLGQSLLTAVPERILQCWLPRYRPETALKAANYVLFLSRDSRNASAEELAPLKHLLTAFTALETFAEEQDLEIDLGTVRIHLCEAANPPLCFFVGTLMQHGAAVPFTSSYHDNTKAFRLPRGLIEEKVVIHRSDELVDSQLRAARLLAEEATCHTWPEFKTRFGYLIEAAPHTNKVDTQRRLDEPKTWASAPEDPLLI